MFFPWLLFLKWTIKFSYPCLNIIKEQYHSYKYVWELDMMVGHEMSNKA